MMEQNTSNLNTRLSQVDWFDEIRNFIADEPANSEGHFGRLQEYIISHPLDQQAFALLAEVYDKMNRQGEAIVCLERALQLKELSEGKRQSGGAGRLEDLQRAKRIQKPLVVQNCQFSRLKSVQDDWGKWFVGRSVDGDRVIRILIEAQTTGSLTFQEEVELRKELGEKGCICIIPVIGSGDITADLLYQSDVMDGDAVIPKDSISYPYVLESYVPRDRGYYLADIILGLLELKGMGIGFLEISTNNIQYDSAAGIIRFCHFNDAFRLSDSKLALNPRPYLVYLDREARKQAEKIGKKGLWRRFSTLDWDRDVWPLFKGESFNLSGTHSFSEQKTTGDPKKAYHQLGMDGFTCDGVRELVPRRREILEKIFSRDHGKVLDLGCGSGQVGIVAVEKGHSVLGIDLDLQLMNGGQMLANALRMNETLQFKCADVDLLENIPDADVILALGFLENTDNPEAIAKRMNKASRASIIIEGNPRHSGFKWIFDRFVKQRGFQCPDFDDWLELLGKWLADFELFENHGQVDGDNWILEFRRKKDC